MLEVVIIALAIWIVTFSIGNYIHYKKYGNTIFKEKDNGIKIICLFYAPIFMMVMVMIRFTKEK